MKRILYACVPLLFCGLTASAKIWRVNNNVGVVADFNNTTTAIAAASVHNGDTIHIEASASGYSGFSLTKRLVIIGTGYFFTDATPNPKTQANINAANIGSIDFQAGSGGSVVEGLTIGGAFIEDNNITLQRNYINSYVYLGNVANAICDGDTVRQNFIYGLISSIASAKVTNLMVYNNIFNGTGFDFSGNINNTTGFALNNNFIGGSSFSCINMTFQNNIMNNPSFGSFLSSNAFFNNIANNTGIPSGNGNQQSVNLNNVFNGFSSGTGFSSDGRYILKSGSVAANAGLINGVTVNCGAFGGPAPYILSGMPPLPGIYALTVPASVPTGTGTINITVSSTTLH